MTKDDTWQAALDILSRRRCSSQELRQKLKRKGCPEEAAEEALRKLQDYGYVNDEAYAEALFEKLCRLNKHSWPSIAAKLRQHGISPVLISQLSASYTREQETDSIRKILSKRFPVIDKDNMAKVYRTLAGKGFSRSAIEQAIPSDFHADE